MYAYSDINARFVVYVVYAYIVISMRVVYAYCDINAMHIVISMRGCVCI